MANNTQNLLIEHDSKLASYEPAAYIIIDGKRRYVRTIGAFKKLTRQRLKQNQSSANQTKDENLSSIFNGVFKEGNLFRGAIEREIYIIESGFRKYIYPALLDRYCGKKVWTVDDEELARIPILTNESCS